MNVILSNQPLTMSSREIAELTGKQHGHVKRDIRKMLSSMGKNEIDFRSTYKDARGRTQTLYKLNAEDAICLISGYDLESRVMITSRLKDMSEVLEAIRNFEIPDDLPDMYVYAIQEAETGRIKIGISRDPQQRLKQLQTGNSQELKLVAYQEAKNRFKDEHLAHIANSSNHIRGEWFSSSASIEKESTK